VQPAFGKATKSQGLAALFVTQQQQMQQVGPAWPADTKSGQAVAFTAWNSLLRHARVTDASIASRHVQTDVVVATI
jgi:hypothetical protein